jgi:hypothetical protein
MSSLRWSTPSGSLGIANENSLYAAFFAYDMVPYGDLILLSGEVPPGLTLDSLNGSLTGFIPFIEKTKEFVFTLRLKNILGVIDRTFSITVTNEEALWLTPNVIQFDTNFFRQEQVIDYQLEVYDPGNGNITYELIAGKLPMGVNLLSDGRLVGFIGNEPGVYEFTIRANASIILDKKFQLLILDDNGNRPPFWSTLPGWLGDISEGQFFSFRLNGGDSDLNPFSFSLHPDDVLPLGITLSNSGQMSGILQTQNVEKVIFRVNISDGQSTVTRRFFIRTNFTIFDQDLFIIQPPGSTSPAILGTLEKDEDAYFRIQAFNTSQWVRYEISSGILPNGLTLNTTTGDIEGTIALTAVEGNYDFTVKAFNDILLEDEVDFRIVVSSRFVLRNHRVSALITGTDRRKFNEYFYNYHIEYKKIYRAGDNNFGLTFDNEMILQKYVDIPSQDDLYLLLKDRIRSIGNPKQFKSVPVLNSKSEVICEAVLCMFNESNVQAISQFTSPAGGTTVRNASFEIIRSELQNEFLAPINAFENYHTDIYRTSVVNNWFNSTNHDLFLGKVVYFSNQNIPSPFLNDTNYFAIPLDNNRFRLAASLSDAENGAFITFNVNDSDRSGVYYTYHAGIPIVYVKRGFGQEVAQKLNTAYQDTFKDVKLYLQYIVYGPTETRNQADLRVLWFDGDFTSSNGD